MWKLFCQESGDTAGCVWWKGVWWKPWDCVVSHNKRKHCFSIKFHYFALQGVPFGQQLFVLALRGANWWCCTAMPWWIAFLFGKHITQALLFLLGYTKWLMQHGTVDLSQAILYKSFAFAVATNKDTHLGQRPRVKSPFSLCLAVHIKFPLEKLARVFWNLIQYENEDPHEDPLWNICMPFLWKLWKHHNQTITSLGTWLNVHVTACIYVQIFMADLFSHGDQLSMSFLRVIMRIHDASSKTSFFSSSALYWIVQSNAASRGEVQLWY